MGRPSPWKEHMNPSHLALKILCQPHMTLLYLAEYLEQEETQKDTLEFRADMTSQLREILAAVRAPVNPSEHRSRPIVSSRITSTTVAPLTGIQTVIFSFEGLSRVLVSGGPVEIGVVVFGSLALGESCRIPVGLSELEALEISWDQDKLSLQFATAYGRFGTNKNREDYRPPQDTLIVSERSRKKYVGSLTIKGYGQDVGVQAGFSRSLKTSSSAPILSVPGGRGLHMMFTRGDEVLREVMLLLLDR